VWQVWQEGPQSGRLPLKKLSHPRRLDEWIPTLTGVPVPPRRRPETPAEQAILSLQTQQWLEEGIIELIAHAPYENNKVYVEKSNGSIRVCIDCTPANRVTEDYDWPLPALSELRFFAKGYSWFAKVDLRSAFFRIKIPPAWRHLTAFRADGKTYQFRRMPFGLKTAPAVFQQFMDTRLAPLRDICYWYIDDILVRGHSQKEVQTNTEALFRQLRIMGCEDNSEKNVLCTKTLIFAGMMISSEGIGPNHASVAKVAALPLPRTKKEKQSALGLIGYLRDFVPLASHLSAGLYPGGRELPPAEYEKQWKAFLKHVIKAVTQLSHFDEKSDADLYTDGSNTGVAAVLIQKGRIVALTSRLLTDVETRYSATDREHLALLLASQKFRPFLHRVYGRTKVYSDHMALLSRKRIGITPRQYRWQHLIGYWITGLEHVPGIENPADYFSRWNIEIFGWGVKT
jgi:hypothetical protein